MPANLFWTRFRMLLLFFCICLNVLYITHKWYIYIWWTTNLNFINFQITITLLYLCLDFGFHFKFQIFLRLESSLLPSSPLSLLFFKIVLSFEDPSGGHSFKLFSKNSRALIFKLFSLVTFKFKLWTFKLKNPFLAN